jgi:transposase
LEDEVTRVVTGLMEYRVLSAVEVDGTLELTVVVARDEAPCPRCGVFSARVKQRTTQRVRDGLSFERPTVLVWHKRRFRCDTPGCAPSFTESTVEVPARARLTTRLRGALGRAGRCCSTAEVARAHGVSWWTTWRAIADAARAALAASSSAGPPARVGFDETTFRRPQRFATGIVDLDTGRLWDLLAGRSKSVVVQRLNALDPDHLSEITDVVIDRSPATRQPCVT